MAIRLVYPKRFLKSVGGLPQAQQRKLASLLTILHDQPFDKRLHTKALSGSLTGFYSLRITRDWRVIFQFLDARTIQLVDVAHRKEVYR
ncbi:type II toxin-antitoxin system mRNA interferase toxin, RelE/StbE family [Candidatus Berkelbacteria bacterium]|nr:type II toxin-antitoxin system mRNA interferase toxin, RelE/StbE family [Candidatus Berkelbacteria bacterium]